MITKKYVIGAAARAAREQTHVHEVQGMTEMAAEHTHRFAGTTGEMITSDKCGHKHEFHAITDYVNGHYHKIYIQTNPNVSVSDDEHVHYAEGCTSVDKGHKHEFELTTFQAPIPGKE